MNPNKDLVLGVDPGDTTGIAVLDAKTGICLIFQQLTQDECNKWLESFFAQKHDRILAVVYEDFVLYKRKALQQSGSRFVASQVIGVVKLLASRYNLTLIRQPAENKDTGAKLSQVFPPKNHRLSHWVDAYNHGFFYLVKHHQIPTALDKLNAAAQIASKVDR